VLTKAGIKVAHADSYSGGADLEEFKIFVAGVLRWLRIASLGHQVMKFNFSTWALALKAKPTSGSIGI
jgi:hypothetical protein